MYDYLASEGREYFSTLSDTAAIVVEFPAEGSRNVNAYEKKLTEDIFYDIDGKKYCFDNNGRPIKGIYDQRVIY